MLQNSYINMNIAPVLYHMRIGILFCSVKATSDTFWTQPFPFLSSYHSHWLFKCIPIAKICVCVITMQEASHGDLPAFPRKRHKTNPEKFTLPDCSYGGTTENTGLVLA